MSNKIFLDDLPHKGSHIDWFNSIGYKVNFIYKDIKGELEIIDYIREVDTSYLKVKYKNNITSIRCSSLKMCQLGKILGTYYGGFRIKIGEVIKDDRRNLLITKQEKRKRKNRSDEKWYKYTCNKCG